MPCDSRWAPIVPSHAHRKDILPSRIVPWRPSASGIEASRSDHASTCAAGGSVCSRSGDDQPPHCALSFHAGLKPWLNNACKLFPPDCAAKIQRRVHSLQERFRKNLLAVRRCTPSVHAVAAKILHADACENHFHHVHAPGARSATPAAESLAALEQLRVPRYFCPCLFQPHQHAWHLPASSSRVTFS